MEFIAPGYVRRSVPVSPSDRVPWYKNTFPRYAAVSLWVGFYVVLAWVGFRPAVIGGDLVTSSIDGVADLNPRLASPAIADGSAR